ncbi:hypothetical protein GIB67_009104 [Kingdonia uniflora]|uniref:SANT domain-containing protein n=1 Tax=Kingdonia uniflora TaxID=39325 RepID=A0A7J7N3K9_9MAGN|nr:hypothetical protein GIB67_009104 [Kingdonia uniflora]
MELQLDLEVEGSSPSVNFLSKNGDSGLISSSPSLVDSGQPVKKQTRQWAAWTRQEEESFFNALRQFGKNFEKITSRVQSKNKEQAVSSGIEHALHTISCCPWDIYEGQAILHVILFLEGNEKRLQGVGKVECKENLENDGCQDISKLNALVAKPFSRDGLEYSDCEVVGVIKEACVALPVNHNGSLPTVDVPVYHKGSLPTTKSLTSCLTLVDKERNSDVMNDQPFGSGTCNCDFPSFPENPFGTCISPSNRDKYRKEKPTPKPNWNVRDLNNKVRHYYYRLVTRMNKLLGPGFSLDAKNFKDTNAAMLRWWSLLEKYSCKASKLHLKPRRFKIFIEALEHQLLKDRKKTIRRRTSPQCESCSSASSAPASLHSNAVGYDTRSVKVIIVDSQNIQKVGSGKRSLVKRSGNNRNSNKGDLSTVKAVRQRRKTGRGASSAAYKRWEKAATAGVSLVADAAEHLERTTTVTKASIDKGQGSSGKPLTWTVPTTGNMDVDTFLKFVPSFPLSTSSQHQVPETSMQGSAKLKLQFFPIDEATRRALEKDELNPHLELTLSARKKISSVVEHLNLKWGSSSIASGELMLFPYSAQGENLAGYQRWSQGSVASAGDVYATIGSPPIFRLRYGWLSSTESISAISPSPPTSHHLDEEGIRMNTWNRKEQIDDDVPILAQSSCHDSDQLLNISSKNALTKKTIAVLSYTEFPDDKIADISVAPVNNLPESSDQIASPPWVRKESSAVDNMRTCSGFALSTEDWADSLTNISVGELLTESSRAMDMDDNNLPVAESSQFFQQIPFSCDSFDAAIAAHIFRSGDKRNFLSAPVSHASSIWDSEETCDAFSFQKISTSHQEIPSPCDAISLDTLKQIGNASSRGFRDLIEEVPEVGTADGLPLEEDMIDNCNSVTDSYTVREGDSTKDLGGLAEIYWPDSLGPLDMDMTSYRYPGQDFMFTDSISLSGLNRLIANSLDAFQNCSFFSLDKKEPSTPSDAHGNSIVFNHKVGSEV